HTSNPYHQSIDTVGCDEVWINGIGYTEDIQVKDTLFTIYECDSVYRCFNVKINRFNMLYNITPEDPYEIEQFTINITNQYNGNFEVLSWQPQVLFSQQNKKTQTIALVND